jgi:hypothetical protein
VAIGQKTIQYLKIPYFTQRSMSWKEKPEPESLLAEFTNARNTPKQQKLLKKGKSFYPVVEQAVMAPPGYLFEKPLKQKPY